MIQPFMRHSIGSKTIAGFALAAVLLCGLTPAHAAKPLAGGGISKVDSALSYLRSRIAPSGLMDSYSEDNVDYSYTYDNALAALAFISAGDYASARRILDAYNSMPPEPAGGFLHRYHAETKLPEQGILYGGPNAYLLQAMNLYLLQTGDGRYNALAQRLGNFLLTLQDSDGGLFGRAGVTWKSTENNLGALSALHNLGKVQNIPLYIERAAMIRNFLVTECWDGVRFLQGENDPTIVTDTQALGAIVLGFGYTNGAFWVEKKTRTTRVYSGRKKVTGFDFDTDRDMVWTEGTLQESLAFLVAGDLSRSNSYKTESEKLRQSSGGFWQVSNPGTAGGEILQKWQAVAPTAWYVYVANQDNVLELLA